MSGHSKWATIRHKKGALDAKRGRVFTKLIKEITIAARMGGGDSNGNPRLRTAMDAARAANMPQDNITRAIKKGTGELEGVNYEEVTYEGYGPGGVAMLVECQTDNRNRTASEIRSILTRHNSSLGEVGCVNWLFHKKGLIIIETPGVSEDDVLSATLDAGAEDVKSDNNTFEVVTALADLEKVKAALQQAKIPFSSAKLTMIPQNTVHLEDKEAEQMLKLLEALEDHDDVQNVYANFDISDEVMEKITVE
ncbi:MAG: YebC/PmpR family DNA-binding transcriptional regulator [bacterium]|nr:YebC/PmpR family DNA-binding transcriptional regulator [bacterium]